MTKYYLLENRDLFFPSNTYTIDVTDKKFLKTIKTVKKDRIPVFVTYKRKPIDSYDDSFSEEDVFDSNGFNVFEHIGENKKFSIVMISIAVVQTLIIQFGGKVFSTVPMDVQHYIVALLIAVLIIPADLIRKALTKNK